MAKKDETTKRVAEHIFNVSATMIGVCLTVVSLFKITNTHFLSIGDEIISVDTFLFISSCLISYMSLRKNNNRKLEIIADVLFFIGMFVVVIVGIIMVFSAY